MRKCLSPLKKAICNPIFPCYVSVIEIISQHVRKRFNSLQGTFTLVPPAKNYPVLGLGFKERVVRTTRANMALQRPN